MSRSGAVWLLSLPPAAIGWLAAHALAYVLVAPHHDEREELLSTTGHDYLHLVPVLAGCAVALLLAGLALAIADGVRGRARGLLPVWTFALLPPLGFAVQEHVERLIATNAVPVGVVLEPAFLAGMALQLPFAAVALIVARAALALGHELGSRAALRPLLRPPLDDVPSLLGRTGEPVLARPLVLADGHAQRAPPRLAVGAG